MTDLYAILDVPRDATPDDIKKAYRDKAKTMHPDASGGGNPDKFAKLAEAYDILMDAERRDRYDTLGSTTPVPPIEAEAVQALLMWFDSYVEQMTQADLHGGTQRQGLFDGFRGLIRESKLKFEAEKNKFERKIDQHDKAAKKFKPKKGKAHRIEPMLDAMRRGLMAELDMRAHRIAVMQKATEILDDYENDEEKAKMTFQNFNFTGASTSTW